MARNLQLRQLLMQQLQNLNTSNDQNFNSIIESQNYSLLLSILRELRALLEDLTDEPQDSSLTSRLEDLVGNEIEVTTEFAPITGRLLTTQTDYIVLRDGTSNYFVPLTSIEAISTLS